MKKLNEKQQNVINILEKYPTDLIMWNGKLTGGHGVSFDMRTVNSLRKLGLISSDGRLIQKQ